MNVIDEAMRTDRPAPDRFNIGQRLKALRIAHKLTVAALSERAGVARSTISKIENSQMSPTFDVIQKLCEGLGENIAGFFSESGNEFPTGRRSITRHGQGKKYNNNRYDHEVLCTDLSHKKMFAALSTIKARDIKEFDNWVSHGGEEFFHVISGEVMVYSELYEPLHLKAGDSMYYDCTMGHATISASEEDAKILWVLTSL